MPDTSVPIDGRTWRLAWVIVAGAFMSVLTSTLVNVAIDPLSHDLHASIGSVQWLSSGYLIALSAALPVAGWLAGRVGTTRLWLLALAAFTLASALCAVAASLPVVLSFRVVQGLAGGALVPAGQMILARLAGPQRIGRIMSVVGVAVLLGPALGPTVGGYLVQDASWRWLFWVNVPFGLVGLVAGFAMLPRDEGSYGGGLDVAGVVLVASGLPLFTYGVAEIARTAAFGAAGTSTVLAGVALLAGFAVRELRVARPLLDLRLLARPVFGAAAVASFLVGAALYGAEIVLPLYFQGLRGESSIDAGLLMLPLGLGAAVVMPLAGRWTDRFGGGRVAVAGLALTTVASLPLVWLDHGTGYVWLSGLLAARGVGMGLSMIPLVSAAYGSLAPADMPHAAPQLNMVQRIGGSLGTALLSVVLARHFAAGHAVGGFAVTGWVLVAIAAAALVPAALVARRRAATQPIEAPRPPVAAARS